MSRPFDHGFDYGSETSATILPEQPQPVGLLAVVLQMPRAATSAPPRARTRSAAAGRSRRRAAAAETLEARSAATSRPRSTSARSPISSSSARGASPAGTRTAGGSPRVPRTRPARTSTRPSGRHRLARGRRPPRARVRPRRDRARGPRAAARQLSYTNAGFALAPARSRSRSCVTSTRALGHDVSATNLKRVLLRRDVLSRPARAGGQAVPAAAPPRSSGSAATGSRSPISSRCSGRPLTAN